jgi:DNA helicase II / ATP-dependent DNA helicase PcrA
MPPRDLLTDLTDAQREAVTHSEGPLLILAAAGSGKTRVITRRVAHLLQLGVRAGNILAITFTNKAAGEMRQRVEDLAPGNRVWISTFHSFGARLLRQYADNFSLDRNFTIYDMSDRGRLLKMALEDAGLDNNRFSPDSIGAAISKAKNQLLSPERYASGANDFYGQTVARVYPIYEKRLRDSNALDFDDLLLWPALALRNNAELRAELDARFRYVLIDEYQDTNHAQYAIARGLSIDNPNLCVVGDPDQSIYKFRGSDIRNILDFERDFPDARILTLSLNYRSTKAILAAAAALIAHNKQRKPKDLQTENPAGHPVTVLTYENGQDEAEGIAKRIREAVTAGKRSYRDYAVFLRVNALSRGLETAFVRQRVPFQIVKGLAFFDRKENKDVLAYLRLLVNPRDDLSFLRAVNEPTRGVGKVSLEHLRAYAEPREMNLLGAAREVSKIPAIKGKAAAGLRDFAALMTDLAKKADAPPDEVIREVLDRSGYRRMLLDSTDPEDQERLANIEELITAAKQFAAEDTARTIGDFLENVTLASDVDSWNEKQDCVSVMTMHSAKGLEFPVVFLAGMEDGLFPHQRSVADLAGLEEERRLCYVGATRAMRHLYITYAEQRRLYGVDAYGQPSRFISELPPDLVEEIRPRLQVSRPVFIKRSSTLDETPAAGMRMGSRVRHSKFGDGVVLNFEGNGPHARIQVNFERQGTKWLMLSYANLEVV